tara:strand:+ start:668 stop:955 length:288 start_codon:yes stop_codon:yes gene_type:complete
MNKEENKNVINHPDKWLDFVIWDNLILHGKTEAEVIQEVLYWCNPNEDVDKITKIIKQKNEQFLKDHEEELKKEKTECIYKTSGRLPGSGWSNQK